MNLRRISPIVTVLVLACGAVSLAGDGPALETDQQKALYALGVGMSDQIVMFDLSPDEIAFVQAGIADGLRKSPRLQPQAYAPQINELYESRRGRVMERTREEGQAFLEQFAGQPGARVTDSGLAYMEIEAGSGASPGPDSTVQVHYVGKFVDGRTFDSSVEAGQPVTFPLNGVVPCFAEGLRTMLVGGKSKLVCPPDLAYGEAGSPPVIPPQSTLVFEIELLDVIGEPVEESTP